MRVINFKEVADRLNVPGEVVRNAFEKGLKTNRLQGWIGVENKVGIRCDPKEVNELIFRLNSEKTSIRKLAADLNLSENQVLLVVKELKHKGKIIGLIDNEENFVSDTVRKKLESQKISKIAAQLNASETTVQLVTNELKNTGKITGVLENEKEIIAYFIRKQKALKVRKIAIDLNVNEDQVLLVIKELKDLRKITDVLENEKEVVAVLRQKLEFQKIRKIAGELNISENEVLQVIKELKDKGKISGVLGNEKEIVLGIKRKLELQKIRKIAAELNVTEERVLQTIRELMDARKIVGLIENEEDIVSVLKETLKFQDIKKEQGRPSQADSIQRARSSKMAEKIRKKSGDGFCPECGSDNLEKMGKSGEIICNECGLRFYAE